MKKKQSKTLIWEEAPEIKNVISQIIAVLEFPHIQIDKIFCYRSHNSSSRSYARIWTFPKIFQQALNIKPSYVIEVLAKHYDPLSPDERVKVLIHELLHIPKNFSGALLPHRNSSGKHVDSTVKQLFKEYKKKVEV